MAKDKKQRTMESWMIANGKAGEHFYSDKEDRCITAISSYYHRKIVTERLITITTSGGIDTWENIVKVTLL